MTDALPAARTVLLVEDSDAIRDAFTILLEDAGYTVLGAGTGEDALRLAADRVPDLMLLDMGLPDMTGLDVVRQVKAAPQTAGIAVVAVTGRDEDSDRKACLAAGCAAYIVKPVNTQKLVRDLPGFMGTDVR